MGAIFSPIFPSHRHTLWARNFSFEYVKWGYLKFHPLKGFFDTIIRSACRSQNVVLPFTRRAFFRQLLKLSIWRDWPRDLKFGMWHPSTFLSSGKIRNPPRTPPSLSFFIFAKNRKNFISRFSARRSRKKVWYHKIKIVGKVHIWLTRKNFSPIGWRV